MDDSLINPILLSSSVYLENVEKLIRNIEEHTLNVNNENIIDKSRQIRSQSNPPSSPPQQQISNTSWREMKKTQRIQKEFEKKDTRPLSSINLYKIFQQKSQINASTSHRQQNDQAVQTSILLQNQYQTPSKSLPDLSFIAHYSKELPRSLTTSSSSSINITRTTPSPTLIHQQKQESDRPRTLKSIKRYKNSKHSTEPLNVFYSPQLRKNFRSPSRIHHSNDDLLQETPTKQNQNILSPSNDHLSLSTKRYGEMRRCQTDIIVVDHHSFTDSPPNEFCLQADDDDDDDDEILMEKSHINILPLNSMNDSHLLERIYEVIKRLFEIKRVHKTFFLNNEQNLELDTLLKNDLCPAIQNILEHGRKDLKKINLWKIIQISIEQNTSSSQQFYQAKQIAQNASSNWIYKFQAFIFALLNKNELINWLYYFTRQKDLIQRYYQSPDALILVSISSTFNLFERIMTQLEKLTSLPFHLTYHPPVNDDQLNTSVMTTNAKDWVMTLSRRTIKPIHSNNDTFRSTLTRKLNSIFTKTKSPSVVTTKLSEPYVLDQDLTPTFQSKIPRPSLNVDKPKSVRYRSTRLPLK